MGLGYHFANALSISLFLYYGLACLFADGMVEEVKRYGLPHFRRLIGALEVAGALGLLAGYLLPTVRFLSASGLSVLMLLGLAVRVKVRDSFFEMVPAAVLLLLNAFIAIQAFGQWA